ncbi:DoxX-like family protein, partial [Acinetobacter baumannii]
FKNIPKHLLANTAIASWSILLFRYVLALVWLITAALSFGLYPVADSLKLLQPLGLNGTPAMATLMAASTLDFGMGIATLLWPG